MAAIFTLSLGLFFLPEPDLVLKVAPSSVDRMDSSIGQAVSAIGQDLARTLPCTTYLGDFILSFS